MTNAARIAKVAKVLLNPWPTIPMRSATKVAALKKVRLPDHHFMLPIAAAQCAGAGFPENSGTRPGKILAKTFALK